MSEGLIFNHHSIPHSDKFSVEKLIPEFIKLCSTFKTELQMNTILLDEALDTGWYNIKLAPGYYFRDWLNDPENQERYKDYIRVFRILATQTPLFRIEDIGGDLELFDVLEESKNERFSALRAAAYYKWHLCGFPGKAPWHITPIKVVINTLSDSGELETTPQTIKYFFNMEILNRIKPEILAKQQEGINKGRGLLEYCTNNALFLRFCGKSKSQLIRWSHGNSLLKQVKECLMSLNSYGEEIKKKTITGYTPEKLRNHGFPCAVHGESASVNDNPDLKKLRMFYLPDDGRCEYFEAHGVLSNGFRLHFYPDVKTGIIYIGYIGPHLPTKKH